MNLSSVLENLKGVNPTGLLKKGTQLFPRYSDFYANILNFKMANASGMATSCEEYLEKTTRKIKRVKKFRKLLKEFQIKWSAGRQILDIGAGYGQEALALSHWLRGGVFALDRMPRFFQPFSGGEAEIWIKQVYEFFQWAPNYKSQIDAFCEKNVFWVQSDATSLPLKNKSVDLVFSVSTLEHICHVERAIHEIWRVLKPGGLAYLKWSNYHSILGAHQQGLVDIPWGHVFLRKDELIHLIKEVNPRLNPKSLALVSELNAYSIREWETIIFQEPWKRLVWNLCRDEMDPSLIPSWVISELPEHLTVDDIMVADIEALLSKPL